MFWSMTHPTPVDSRGSDAVLDDDLALPPVPSGKRRWRLPTRAEVTQPHRLALYAIMLVSLFANFWSLGQNGYANLYYAATVKSMGSNWHAFFFASFDPAGFVSVDKPPLGFWFQVLSTKILGYSAFAILFPQALAGVLSVLLIYWLVRRHFGPVAGLIAGAVLAVSPISVVTNRNNTIDSTLMLVLLLAAWATFRAIETDRARWLLGAALLIGVGFNIKMLEAYLIVPALALAYLVSSRKPLLRRIVTLAGSGLAMIGLSFLWVVIVDLVPAGLRPWVGSTSTNSELSLALGYNGIQRLLGMGGGGGNGPGGGTGRPGAARGAGGGPSGSRGVGSGGSGGFGPGTGSPPGGDTGAGSGTAATAGSGLAVPGAGGTGGPGGGGGAGMFNTGTPGIFRLFSQPLGGQIVWFLPLALIGIVALTLRRRFQPREDRQQQALVLWGVWLLTTVVFFSAASFFHQYYLSQMAPAIAAMSGIGIVTMWDLYQLPDWRGWLLPFALVATAAEQIYMVVTDPSWGTWLIPVIAVPTALAVGVLVALRLRPQLLSDTRALMVGSTVAPARDLSRWLGRTAVAFSLVGLLALPTVWSLYPAVRNTASDLPTAGATAMVGNAAPVDSVNTKLISYLEAHQGSATYLVATSSSNAADAIIIATGKSVMALGGFSGSDPILTTAKLQALIKAGTVRYFLVNGGNTRALDAAVGKSSSATSETSSSSSSVINVGGPTGSNNSAVQWVEANCAVVPASTWQSSSGSTAASSAGGSGGQGSSQTLYDCVAK